MKNFLKRLCVLALVVALCLPGVPMIAYADEEPDPAAEAVGFKKARTDNGDGTYTISLQVVGDALVESVVDSSANILIVYDASSSMTYCRAPQDDGAYGGIPQNNTWGGTDYYQLFYTNTATNRSEVEEGDEIDPSTTLYYHTGNNWNNGWNVYNEKYADGSYKRFGATNTRADFAEDALHDFCQALSVYSGVQIAVVTFNSSASQRAPGWTTAANAASNFDEGTGDGYNLTYNNDTRWDLALNQALTTLGNANTNDTYVIFVTDGQYYPETSGGTNVFTQAKTYSRRIEQYDTVVHNYTSATGYSGDGDNTTFFGIYAFGTNDDYLDDLVYYSQTGTNRASQTGATVMDDIEDNYFRAESAEDFLSVIDVIFQKIVSALGIEQVSISDGTTNQVQISGGKVAELLDVDESSYMYYLTIPMTSTNGSITFIDNNLNEITATENGSNLVMTWTDSTGSNKTATYEIVNKAGSVFKLKWTEKTDFYPAPPAAQLTTSGAVDWDLNSLGTLLEGVTYTYSFDVWPSQYSLDLLADLKNGYIEYKDLPSEIKPYVSEDGSIATNTEATVTYTDSRTTEGAIGPVKTPNPEPVATQAIETLAIGKVWENVMDEQEAEPVTLFVARDGVKRYEVELGKNDVWTGEAFISVGIMTVDTSTGAVVIKAGGHDYEFMESDAVSFHWEIDAPVVHPMKINGSDPVNLVKVDPEDVPSGMTKDYYNDGTNKYYRIAFSKFSSTGAITGTESAIYMESDEGTTLTATNSRKSYLDVIKAIEGDAPEDALFTFKLQVDDPNGDDVWFSIYNAEEKEFMTGSPYIPSNATAETSGEALTGYYYVKDNEAFTVQMEKGWSLRVLNLSTKTICVVEELEDDLPDMFKFVGSEINTTTWDTTGNAIDEGTTAGAIKNTFTIPETNHAYTMTYTNKYELGLIKIIKTVSGDAEMPADAEFIVEGPSDFTTTVAFNTFEEDPSDSAIKSYTISGLKSGEYTVTETGAAVEGFSLSTTGSGESKTVSTGALVEFEIENTYTRATGALTITKTVDGLDEGTTAPAFSFTVDGPDKFTTEASITLEEGATSGSITLTGLPTGEYTVTEDTDSVAVSGYTFDTSASAVETTASVIEDTTASAIISNVYTKDVGTLTIVKTIVGATLDDVGGTTFTIEGTGVSETVTLSAFDEIKEAAEKEAKPAFRSLEPLEPTDDGGTYTYTIELPVGTYTVTESDAELLGYELTMSPTTGAIADVEIKQGEDTKIEFTNTYGRLAGVVVITKNLVGLDEEAVAGPIEFVIESAEIQLDKAVAFTTTVAIEFEEGVTTASIEVKDLPSGDYIVYEVTGSAFVEGYTLTADEEVKNFSISDDETPEVVFTNTYEALTGILVINKKYEGHDVPADTLFTVTQEYGDVPFEDFTVTYGAFTNDSYELEVPYGDYEVTESNAEVPGYILETTYEGDSVPMKSMKTDDYALAMVWDEEGSSVTVTNVYTMKTGDLSIEKTLVGVDAELAQDMTFVITSVELESGEDYTTTVAFSDFMDVSAPAKKTEATRELKPLDVDESISSKWTKLIVGVPVGTYEVTEENTDISGYLLDESASTMTAEVTVEYIDEEETTTGALIAIPSAKLKNIYALLGDDLVITKTVTGLGEDVEIPTFYFEVISYEEEAPVTIAAITPTEVDKAESITVPGLPAGRYLVNELEPDEIEGYALVEMPDQVTVEIGGEEDPLAEFTNEYEATTGTVTIAKQTIGAALEDLPGDMTFILTGPKETVEIQFSEFDEEGVYTLENMPMGEYSILEVASSAAIPGLELSAVDYNKEKDTLEGGGEINFVVTNAYDTDTATIVIVKKHKGATPPDGTEFKITGDDYSTEVYYEDFTDGKIEVVVPTGSYTVLETESTAQLKNYDLEVEYSTKGSFKLEMGDTFEVTITNTYTKEIQPPPILDTENHDAYIIGYPDGTVQPEGNITRAEVVTIFFRLLTDKSRSQYWETENDFDDVNVENWFNNAVSTMANAGIIKGYEDGKFKPYNNVTRAELATMAARFLTDTKGGSESKNYSDTEDSWAKAEIELASRYGIVNGYDDGTFKPNQAITRAEAMTLINRLLKRNPHEDHLLKNMVTWPDNSDKSAWYYVQVQEATNGHTYTWGSDGNGKYEYWKALRKNRDWSALEHEWSDANSK